MEFPRAHTHTHIDSYALRPICPYNLLVYFTHEEHPRKGICHPIHHVVDLFKAHTEKKGERRRTKNKIFWSTRELKAGLAPCRVK